MQLYQGLPVITNKLPLSQRQGVPHHLLDAIPLDATPWTVRQFVRAGSAAIDDIRARGKLPVVVGGTHYYVHALLFRDAILPDGDRDEDSAGEDGEGQSESDIEASKREFPVLAASAEEMYAKLLELDPDMARSWHPRDKRRVQRSLEICLRTGRKVSEIYGEQQREAKERERAGNGTAGESSDDGVPGVDNAESTLRYDPLLLWLAAEDAALKERLNARVGDMVNDGLFEEALQLQKLEAEYKTQGVHVDKTKGIWVSIGYKEMEPWAAEQVSNPQPLDVARESPLANSCIESVQAGTRRYAKRQERYIRLSFAKSLQQAGALARLLLLDATDLARFFSDTVPQAEEITKAFLAAEPLPDPSSLSELAKNTFAAIAGESCRQSMRVRSHCDVCDRTLMTDKEWQNHLSSRGHKRAVQGRRKHLQNLEYLQQKNLTEEAVSTKVPEVDGVI